MLDLRGHDMDHVQLQENVPRYSRLILSCDRVSPRGWDAGRLYCHTQFPLSCLNTDTLVQYWQLEKSTKAGHSQDRLKKVYEVNWSWALSCRFEESWILEIGLELSLWCWTCCSPAPGPFSPPTQQSNKWFRLAPINLVMGAGHSSIMPTNNFQQ